MRLLWRGAQAFIGGLVLAYEAFVGVRGVLVSGPGALLTAPPIRFAVPFAVGLLAIITIEGVARLSGDVDEGRPDGRGNQTVQGSGYNSRWDEEDR